ncbi:MAG: PTS sugar transporter subunit IIB [Tissierellia bacterium]|nr:PTS sugar transporter subunit IIB [Tissierellia bacterium]
MKAIILCSWGATSSSLAKNVNDAAKKRNIDIEVDAGSTIDFKKKADEYDVALLEPQVRHLKNEIEEIGKKHSVKVDLIDMQAFATFDGEKVLDQILSLIDK